MSSHHWPTARDHPPGWAVVTRWARDARAVCDLPVVRQTSRPLGRTTYLKPGRLDAVLPLGGSRGGRYAHETAVRVSMRLQKATRPADVSSAHAKAVGAGSDQAATLRRAGIRELTLATCARRETRRNQSAKLRVGRWSPWMSSGKDFPSIALPPGAPVGSRDSASGRSENQVV